MNSTSKVGNWKQWIADVYHCSEEWGQRMSIEDMRTMLIESALQKSPDDYSPSPFLCTECAMYWNSLCELYPN